MADHTVTLGGNAVPLEGPTLKAGDKAPSFTLQQKTEGGLKDVTLADFAGKTLLLSVVPSLDTSVCALQTKTFNERAAQLPDSVEVVSVSTDLPFAQARFYSEEHIDKIQSASDHQEASFGKSYGVLISEGPFKRILARAVFIIDPSGTLKYVEYVPEIGAEPNYDKALAAL